MSEKPRNGVNATICLDFDAMEAAPPGAIHYLDGGAIIKCPGCGSESFCEERRGDNHPSWTMDHQTQTWQPSVHHSANGCGWHGFLKNGVWGPC